MRPGDNKWSMTIFARNPDTGEAKWAYQTDAARSVGLRRRSTRAFWSICRSAAGSAKSCCTSTATASPTPIDRNTGQLLVGRAVSIYELGERASTSTPAAPKRSRKSRRAKASTPPISALLDGRTRINSRPLLAEDRSVLHADDEPLHGLRGSPHELHRGNPVRRRGGDDVSRPGR